MVRMSGRKVILTEDMLKLIIEGRVRITKDNKLKYGKYRVVRRYVAKDREGVAGGHGNL